MQEFITKIFLPIFIPILTFGLGICSKKIYDLQKDRNDAYKNFYLPFLKSIVINKLLRTNIFAPNATDKQTIEDLISLSFNNLHYMDYHMQVSFMSFCTLWLSYQEDPASCNSDSLLMALRTYMKTVLNNASKNAKRIGKSIPTTVTSWAINYME